MIHPAIPIDYEKQQEEFLNSGNMIAIKKQITIIEGIRNKSNSDKVYLKKLKNKLAKNDKVSIFGLCYDLNTNGFNKKSF